MTNNDLPSSPSAIEELMHNLGSHLQDAHYSEDSIDLALAASVILINLGDIMDRDILDGSDAPRMTLSEAMETLRSFDLARNI